MSSSVDWPGVCSRLLKAEIAREGLTLARLAARLQRLGVSETEISLKNKLYRGTFSMALFMQCMHALGRSDVQVGGLVPESVPRGPALDG